jgi:hypothetical protein
MATRAKQGVGRDTRTTTRWSEEELAWLEEHAAAAGHGKVGRVVREIVAQRMAAAGPGGRRSPSAVVADRARANHAAMVAEDEAASAAARRVRGGAAPSSPSGVAPSVSRVRLEVVVARVLDGGGRGPVPPARLADARRLIRAGRVRVSGRPVSAGSLDPGLLVGPGEVEVLR